MIKKIKEDMKQAMKNKEKTKLMTLRMLLASIETERSKKGLKDISDFTANDIVGFINRNVKTINQEIEAINNAGRDSSNQEEQKEILMSYLPKQLSEKEIEQEVYHAIALTKKGEIRNPMQYLSQKLKGKADMGLVAKIVKIKSSQ